MTPAGELVGIQALWATRSSTSAPRTYCRWTPTAIFRRLLTKPSTASNHLWMHTAPAFNIDPLGRRVPHISILGSGNTNSPRSWVPHLRDASVFVARVGDHEPPLCTRRVALISRRIPLT